MPIRSWTPTEDTDVATAERGKRDLKKLLVRIRDRYRLMVDADHENRREAMLDLKFLHKPGEQWDQLIRLQRGTRPCYEFNKTRIKVKRIVNEMRANRPAAKIRAVEDSDKETADIYEGLFRNIWNVSDGDTVMDYAGEYQVGAGMGAWRVCTDYSDEDSFVQDIRVESIKNPFCLYADPACQDPLKRDAEDWILTEKLSKKAFEAKYPKADQMSFEDVDFDDDADWEDNETVRICEYWYKEPYDREIWLLSDGRAIDPNDPKTQNVLAEMRLRPDGKALPEGVQKLSQPVYADVAPDASADSGAAPQDEQSQLRARVPGSGQDSAASLSDVRGAGLSNAPPGLQPAVAGGVALPGMSLGAAREPVTVVKKRIAKSHRIMQCIASGAAILEGPTVQAGRNHRFVVVYGEWVVVDGKPIWFGLTRWAKDAQRSYNVSRTAATETIASAPLSHIWATDKQALGHTDQWKQAITENLPFLTYTPDPAAAGPPARMGGADVPVAMIQELTLADQELKDVTGVYDSSLGERSNEKSGVAISRRAEQTQIVNFNFPDNMGKGIKRTAEIVIDLIPEIYDTERAVRILGRDMGEQYLIVNQAKIDPQTLEPVVLNDLSKGKYDVTVTVGPSFSTQRQEAAETYTQLAQGFPPLMQLAGDKILRSMDLPYSDDIADRLATMLPPQIQALANKGKPVSPEVAQGMALVQRATEQVQQQGQMVQAAAAEATDLKTEAEKATSVLKVQQAQFEADVAKELAKVDLAKANLALAEAKAQASGIETDSAANQAAFQTLMAQTVAEIREMGANFMQAAAQTMADIQTRSAPQVVVAPSPPKPRIVGIRRENGRMIPEYEDQVPVAPTLQ